MPKALQGVEEFYAHAIAIEREAVERYREFEGWFADRGEEVLAGLCRNLAGLEADHLRQVEHASRGLVIPAIDASRHQWLETGPPETLARDLFYRMAEPRHLLEMVLQAECNALAFFEWVGRTSPDTRVRFLAREMAAEEQQHVQWAAKALEYHVPRHPAWESVLP